MSAKDNFLSILKTTGPLLGAIFTLVEVWEGLGWRTVLLVVAYCLWLAVCFLAVKKAWGRSASHRKRTLVAAAGFVVGVLPFPWVYVLGVDYFLLPEYFPSFRLSDRPYPRMLVALPSQVSRCSLFDGCRSTVFEVVPGTGSRVL